MKKYFILAAVAAISILAASCSKEEKSMQVFKATAEQAAENGKISLSGLSLRWSAGDQISVYDNSSNAGIYALSSGEGTANGEFAYSSGSSVSAAPYSAVYPASIRTGAATVSLPEVQHSADGSLQELPMYAVGDDMDLKFHHLCGVVRFRLSASSAVSVSRIAVATDCNTNGAATISGSGSSVTLSTPSGSNVTTLSCEYGQSISSGHDFYMYLPAGTYSTFRILLTAADGSICSKSANTGITIERGKITTITLSNLTFTAHRFSTTSGSVVFSPGNLQYQASTGTWRFASNQWGIVGSQSAMVSDLYGNVTGSDNANISSSYSGWIDLFGWGTSGYHNSADSYNTSYYPYSTSASVVNYSYNYYGYGPSTNMTDPTITGTSAEYDWGVYNAIRNGGNSPSQWHTLSIDDWSAVMFNRSATTRYAKAQIAGNINGVIVFPDDYVHPDGVAALNSVNTSNADYTTNAYSLFDWFKMEAAGAVFLPAAGSRTWARDVNVEVYNVGLFGVYWTTTTTTYYGAYEATCLYFNSINLAKDYYTERYRGLSVRLVRD